AGRPISWCCHERMNERKKLLTRWRSMGCTAARGGTGGGSCCRAPEEADPVHPAVCERSTNLRQASRMWRILRPVENGHPSREKKLMLGRLWGARRRAGHRDPWDVTR